MSKQKTPTDLLSEEKYYTAESDLAFMSASLYKGLGSCAARTMARLRGEYTPEPSIAMTVGQLVEAELLGEDTQAVLDAHPEAFAVKLAETETTIPTVAASHPELVTKNGTWKSGALTKARELMPEAFECQVSLRSDYDIVAQCVEAVRAQPMLMEYLTGDHQTTVSGDIGGIQWKGKLDVFDRANKRIVDLKVMRDFQRRGQAGSFVESFAYDRQLAIYRELVRQQYGIECECFIVAVSKETPCNVELIEIPAWRCDEIIADLETNAARIEPVWHGKTPARGCGVCDYCRATKRITRPIEFDLVGMSARELDALGISTEED